MRKLEQIFKAIDHTSDGLVTEDKLTGILSNPTVVAYFQTLDVEPWKAVGVEKSETKMKEEIGFGKSFHRFINHCEPVGW